MSKHDLKDRVALVAGATRGAGRGIAIALGERGATVYCTGRSARGAPSPMARPETIEETAELVTAAGGHGVALRCDHGDEAAVAALATQVRAAHGGLDLLVNDLWGGESLIEFGKPVWEMDIDKGWRMMEGALRTHLVTVKHLSPLLFGRSRPLLVEITDGDNFGYRGMLVYDLVKMSIIRLAWDLSCELRPQGVTCLALTPGFLRSEQMLEHMGVTEATWRDAADRDFATCSETPRFVGRAVAALATDPNVGTKNGRVFASWTLAQEYGFTDLDGSQPNWGAHFAATYGTAVPPADAAAYASWRLSAYDIVVAASSQEG